ncbi:MAG TPA: hypothetical protein VFC78_07595 [Tepidisphaeraceae bacterium]|nr:hypothetical protein [Tepidisphaeraceae bacterium]
MLSKTACWFVSLLFAPIAVFAADPQPRVAALRQFPTVGVAFTPPAGWQEMTRDKHKMVAGWVSSDSRPRDIHAMIQVEAAKPTVDDAQATAKAMAGDWGGKVADSPLTLDGKPAWRVESPTPAKSGLQPVEGIIAMREGYVYMIMGGVTPGHSCHDAIESIRKSWKWTPIETPVKHLEFRDKPMIVFNNGVSINFPALMHTYPTKTPNRVLDLGFYNLARNAPDFLAYVQQAAVPAGVKLDALENKLATNTQEKYKLAEAFVWHGLKGATPRAITQPVRIPPEAPDALANGYVMWALIELPKGRLILINFTIVSENAPDRAEFEKAAQKIVGSVQAAKRGSGG